MEVVVGHIAEATRKWGEGATPARITSLGSGPAREVQLFLESRAATRRRAMFTLIDQEPAALKYAGEATYPHLLKAHGAIAVHGLNISFTDILRSAGALAQLPPQHLVYSVGLLDYLSDHRCRALTRRLYEVLAPGGLLIIGNMNRCAMSNHWPMEFAVDWSLHYRDEAEMLAWTEGFAPCRAWTETERTGRVRLLFVEKG
jgi:trans-aconitate methyltransferase